MTLLTGDSEGLPTRLAGDEARLAKDDSTPSRCRDLGCQHRMLGSCRSSGPSPLARYRITPWSVLPAPLLAVVGRQLSSATFHNTHPIIGASPHRSRDPPCELPSKTYRLGIHSMPPFVGPNPSSALRCRDAGRWIRQDHVCRTALPCLLRQGSRRRARASPSAKVPSCELAPWFSCFIPPAKPPSSVLSVMQTLRLIPIANVPMRWLVCRTRDMPSAKVPMRRDGILSMGLYM